VSVFRFGLPMPLWSVTVSEAFSTDATDTFSGGFASKSFARTPQHQEEKNSR
jgi:hypothetical protein